MNAYGRASVSGEVCPSALGVGLNQSAGVKLILLGIMNNFYCLKPRLVFQLSPMLWSDNHYFSLAAT